MMCDFCENIPKTDEELGKMIMNGAEDIIFYDKKRGFCLYGDTGDSGCQYALDNIKFCPICGRKLSEETEKPSTEEILAYLEEKMTEEDYKTMQNGIKLFSDGVNALWKAVRKGIENG